MSPELGPRAEHTVGSQEQADWHTHVLTQDGIEHGSHLFWHQGPVLWKTIFPWIRRSGVGVGEGSGDNVSDKHWQIKLRLLAHHSPPVVQPAS